MILDEPKPKIKLIDRSPKQYIKRYSFDIVSNDLEQQLKANENIIREALLRDLSIHKGLKVNTLFNLELTHNNKLSNAKSLIEGDHYISTEAVIITSEKNVNKFSMRLLEKRGEYNYQQSYINIIGFAEHIINIYKYRSLGGSSYIELPKEHAGKKNGLVNIRDKDNMCFK